MKKTLIFLTTLIITLSFSHKLHAQEVDDEEASDVVTEEEVTDNLKKRLQQTLGTSASDTSETDELPRAFVGSVKDLIQENISIATKDGVKRAIPSSDATILRTPGNAKIGPEDIQIDDFIIAMGYFDDEDTLSATRIIVSQTITTSLNKTTAFGNISKITNSSITLDSDSNPKSLTINSKTVLKNQGETIELEDLEIGNSIIFIASVDDSDNLTATDIMLIESDN